MLTLGTVWCVAQMGPCACALLLEASDTVLVERQLATADSKPNQTEKAVRETVARRVRTFRNQTLPAIQTLESRGVLSEVDASGTADQTFAALAAVYERLDL